jgi:hypothetical protein
MPVRQLGLTTDVATAGAVLGIGRTKAYELAKNGEFPVPLLRVGRRYLVPTQGLLSLLGAQYGVDAKHKIRHAKALAGVFVDSLRLCAEAGVVRLGVIALDGTKIGANASADANRTLEALDKQIAAIIAEAEQHEPVR